MTKSLAILATFLLAGTLAFAQAGQGGMQPGQSMDRNQSQNTVTGCLTGTSGNYRLVTQQGTTYRLTGETSDLADNVGKEVRIQTSSPIARPGASSDSGMNSRNSAGAATATQTLEVQDVSTVADTCQSGAGMGQPGQSGQSGQSGRSPQQ